MSLHRRWMRAVAGGFVVLSLGCGSSDGGMVIGAGGTDGAPCDVSAINACLDLQSCCRAILVNPVFFQSCNSVALQCDEVRCSALLAGYTQCQGLDL